MNKIIGAILLLAPLSYAQSACEPPGRPLSAKFSPAAVEARYLHYLRTCERLGGTLVDGQATHLGERFARPKDPYMLVPRSQRDEPPIPIQGSALIGVVVDEQGKTIEVELITSSGIEATDLQVIQTARRSHYGKPATLDGMPVRFYEAFLISGIGPRHERPGG